MTLTPGCTFWRNFSTYFNTLYLARTHIEAYEASIQAPQPVSANSSVAVQNHRWLDEEYITRELAQREGRTLLVQPTFSRALTAGKPLTNVHLDSAIILGSKILANKKETKYIEDALFLVGKALYYKNDFGGARRKFLELLTKYPDSRYGPDAEMLLARSMVAGHQVDSAESALRVGTAAAERTGDKLVLGELHRTRAEVIYARNPDSLAAIAHELRAAEDGLTGTELSRLAYEEGAIDYFNSDWLMAEAAFLRSAEAANDDWSDAEARIALALTERREGKFAPAIAQLQVLSTRVKYAATQAASRYELAYTQDLAARAQVNGDLRNPEFHGSLSTQLVNNYYALDTLYRNSSAQILARAKFRTAELYREMGLFDSGSKYATGLVGTKDFSSNAMNDLVSTRMRALSKFSYWRNEIARADSLENVARMHPRNTAMRNDDAQIHLRALAEALGGRFQPSQPVTLTREDSIKVTQIETQLKNEKSAAHLAITDTGRFIDSMQYKAAAAHFELGHAYEAFNEAPHARGEYHDALAIRFSYPDTAKTTLHAQVLYALLQLETREHNQRVADSVLNELLANYGQTIFAQQARVLFASSDRNSRGELAYRGAYQTLRTSGIGSAKPMLLDVVGNYAHEDVAPRALYALGLTYEEAERFDSAVIYYRQILKDYPYSPYASAIRPRLADATPAFQAPAHLDPTDTKTYEQKQQEDLERARKLREEQQRKEQENRPPGMPSSENPDQSPQVEQPPPGTPGNLPPGSLPPGVQPPIFPPNVPPPGMQPGTKPVEPTIQKR